MDDRAGALRRRIALYEGYLREPQRVDMARIYVQTIREDKAEVAEIEWRRNAGKG